MSSSGGFTGRNKRLHSIREDGREIDRIFSETQHFEEPQIPTVGEKQVLSTPSFKVNMTSGKGEGQKLMTSGIKRKAPTPPMSI